MSRTGADASYCLAYLTLDGCPPPEMIYLAARAGYQSVGLRTIGMGLAGEPDFELHDNPKLLVQTQRALDFTGLTVHNIELARVHASVEPESYAPAFEVSAELGAKHVISSIWSPGREAYVDKFGRLCEVAAAYGLTVNLEFVPIAEVNDLAGAVDVLRGVGARNSGLMLDMYHCHRAGMNPDDLDELPRGWFNFIHLCDAPAQIPDHIEDVRTELREARLYAGEGGIDLAGYLSHLPEVVYSIELPHLARSKEFGRAEHAARCLDTARGYFAAHPVTPTDS